MNFARPAPSPFELPPMPPAKKRRVVPPASEKVAAARLRFIDAKRAAVEAGPGCWAPLDVAHRALDAWIAAEREGEA